jgi:hypothetical protein
MTSQPAASRYVVFGDADEITQVEKSSIQDCLCLSVIENFSADASVNFKYAAISG